MLTALDKQFKLMDDGQIFFQPDASNPLPGEAVAKIRKGSAALMPVADVMAEADKDAVQARMDLWLQSHIALVLEPLVKLQAETESLQQPVQDICARVYQAMGIIPREQIEDSIAALDAEMRQHLRARKLRLGPVLVFLPDLNKPAAVRLRGLLWALWHDKPLPAGVPADGMVSKRVELDQIDLAFYQSIGYPVYGPRAVRIDMLDRVISAVYDSAKDGKFQARHDMAEWLGCSIEDLYAVLSAMGHSKIEEVPAPETPVEVAAEAPETAEVLGAAPAPAVKPPLAFFRLKKGKAHQKPFERKVFAERPPQPRREDKKPERKARPEHKKFQKPAPKPKPEPRVMEARSKVVADSPFAVLEQLKAKRDGTS